jgi:hypothetical protein
MRKERGDVYRVVIPYTGEKFFLDRNDFVVIDGSRLVHMGRQIPYTVKPMDVLYRHLELVRKATRSVRSKPWHGAERRKYGPRNHNG